MNARSQFPVETSLFGLPEDTPHEKVLLNADPASGLLSIIAIHSTARGPAFGGCRLWPYSDELSALTDALRLSQGMSFKNALADLPFGGGKAVILHPKGEFDRTALFNAFGRAVESARGSYITAEDVGSTTNDMRAVQKQTAYVSGIPRTGLFGGDPSPKTAWGVFIAIETAMSKHLRKSLNGAVVAVQGLGAVGMALCGYLHEAGAKLIVADINVRRVAEAVHRFSASAVDVDLILSTPADVLAPCALGAAMNSVNVTFVSAAMVVGAANNQLGTVEDGDVLHERGILYLPDFLVNAGGIISVAREYLGQANEHSVMQEVALIGGRVGELMERLQGQPPARVAEAWAREKLRC